MSAQPQPRPITAAHPITITPADKHVRVIVDGQTIADSGRALSLREASIPPVLYIPREDVRMDLMTRTNHSTHCPYKGDASYYSVKHGGQTRENVAWSYEAPFDQMSEITGYLAFYPNRVDAIEQA